MFEDDKLYDQIELIEPLKKSKQWFERKRWDGTGPKFIKIGRKPLYRGSDLNAWLDEQVRKSTSDKGGQP
ncbi:hypothetical protein BAE30_06275 [Acidithiobacillus caldus]|uniref:Helix-turn-helix domain-containing protein n=1 Tax=Acidithiobacillus caldus TaxID=33059 RepID=A0A1E7YWZ7_9PROT|nr:hypothetical protein BAE30_06275 [Acidithiobacillus caldus]